MKWNDSEIKILQTYYLTHSAEECIEKFNLKRTVKSLQKKARELGIDKHQKWTLEEENTLKSLWENSDKQTIIRSIPNHSYTSITLKAQELNLKANCCRQRKGSLTFLDNLNSKSAYWWGFITADGHLSPKGELCITISSKDKDYLTVLQKYLNCSLTEHIKSNSYTSLSSFVTLSIQDKKFQEKWYKLLSYNNPKTYNPLNLSIFYQKDILIYFLIGLIDGDGSIWRNKNSKTNKGSISLRIELHPNWENTLKELCNKIFEFYNIKFNIKKSKRGYIKAEIASVSDLKKLYMFVNKDSCDYLNRKWDQVKTFMSQ